MGKPGQRSYRKVKIRVVSRSVRRNAIFPETADDCLGDGGVKGQDYPEKLQELLDTLMLVAEESERANFLISYAERFKEVPAEIARRPFPSDHRVPFCESEAYVWAVPRPDGTLQFHFAVENPSGISAKALAVILDKTLSGVPLSQVACVSPDVVERIFRQNISMGKGMGLMSMVQMVQRCALETKPPA